MKNTTLLILLCLFAFHSSLSAQQNIFPNAKERSSDFENLSAPDSTGKRAKLKSPLLVPNRVETQQIKLPYPVIFIHGLNSGSETWDITTNFMDLQYGFHFGGRIDFCLNFDGNNATANSNFYPAAGADIALFTPLNNLVAGDYYYVNFDVGINGSVHPNGSASDVKSNQSAVVKQGLALRTAIYMVLQATGRDKVILFGHSMGGLASRQYLQNPNIWQPDGKTHVAKLVTTATPHGGSNSTSFGLGIGGVDESSEAVRDLRRTYYYSNNNGVYLFGGVENLSYMNDQLLFNFYNSDVNCNNIGNTNESITGLNQKSIYTNLDYSCIIGECPNCILDIYNGDGVVNNVSANLKNIYPSLNVNLLYYNSNSVSTQIHTEMPKQNYQNIQGLDEPSEFSLSYHIGFDTAYSGFMTVQATNNAYYPVDFDDYKFTVTGNKSVGINVSNITISDLSFTINNSSYQQVGTVHKSNGATTISFVQDLPQGDYYLEFYGIPTASSYLAPYDFVLTTVTGSDDLNNENIFKIYPNPTNGRFILFQNESLIHPSQIVIYNTLGEIIYEKRSSGNKTEIDLSSHPNGVYLVKISLKGRSVIKRFIIAK